jgi:hypothetical protein
LLDCPHEHLVSLCTQHRQLVFPPQYENGPPASLRTFLNQPDMSGVTSFVAKCLALFFCFLLTIFCQALRFQASAQMPPRGIYVM